LSPKLADHGTSSEKDARERRGAEKGKPLEEKAERKRKQLSVLVPPEARGFAKGIGRKGKKAKCRRRGMGFAIDSQEGEDFCKASEGNHLSGPHEKRKEGDGGDLKGKNRRTRKKTELRPCGTRTSQSVREGGNDKQAKKVLWKREEGKRGYQGSRRPGLE